MTEKKTKEYRIEGIKNKIFWDGDTIVFVENLVPGKMILSKRELKRQPRSLFYVTTDTHRHIQCSRGQLLAMLRTGCSLKELRASGARIGEDGYPLSSEHYRKRNMDRKDVFRTLDELDETVDIIKSLHRGDPLPFYRRMNDNRKYLRRLLTNRFSIKTVNFDLLWDEAVAEVEALLRELRMRSLKKPEYYVLSAMKTIMGRRGHLSARQQKETGL